MRGVGGGVGNGGLACEQLVVNATEVWLGLVVGFDVEVGGGPIDGGLHIGIIIYLRGPAALLLNKLLVLAIHLLLLLGHQLKKEVKSFRGLQ